MAYQVPHHDDSRLNVVICTVGELFGGVERHVLGLLDGLSRAGVGSVLLLFHEGELAAQARHQGAEVVILPNSNRSIFATARKLAQFFKAKRATLAHVHGYKAAVFCGLSRSWYPLPIVRTEHGLPEPMSGGKIRMLKDRAYHLADRAATRLTCNAVCYVTKDLEAHACHAHQGLWQSVIPNGVHSMDQLDYVRPPELSHERFNLAIVGRLERVKGIQTAIEALCAECIPEDVQLHIVGNGPCEAELRTQAEVCGVGHRVQFLGFRRNAFDYLAHCDALLMPSLHEGLPYTLLEAMALGKPVIASNVGGLAEVLENSVTGLLVPPAGAGELATAIATLRYDEPLRRRLGQRAQDLQRSNYSLEKMAARYISVYRRLT